MVNKTIWRKDAPTEPGYYWVRYVDMHGVPKEPDIMWLVEPGKAFEFGSEHTWTPGRGCFEYGPNIEPPNVEVKMPNIPLPKPGNNY